MKKNVLIATDFNDLSLNASLKFCKFLFKDSDTKYSLLHVAEEIGFFGKLFGQQEECPDCQQYRFDELKQNIKTLYGLEIDTYVRKGRISNEINNFCKEKNIDLIIAGTSNSRDNTIGANTHRLIRTTDFPILTINMNIDPKPIRNILLPIELLLSSRQKVKNAIEWAKNYNAKITIISGIWEKTENDTHKKIVTIVNSVQDFILNKGVDCEVVMMKHLNESKDYADSVIEYMNNDKNGGDLTIVMGRDESTDFSADPRSQDVVRFAKVPVLCVPLKKSGMSAGFL